MLRTLLIPVPLALAACSFGGKTPGELLSLQSAATRTVDATRTATEENMLTVLVPTGAAAVSGVRIPVYQSGNAVAYVKDAQWIEAPARGFQRLLSETIAARTSRVVLDPRQMTGGTMVSGNLVMFGIDAATNQAVVTFDAQRTASGGRITIRRFEARAPIAVVDAANASAALNQAANGVARDIADWVE